MSIEFVNKGTFASGTTSCSPGIPASMRQNDLMILVVGTPNQAVTTPSGWTAATSSPVGQGTTAAAGATRATVFYRFWVSGDAAPTVSVTGGNNVEAIILGYRGVDNTTPFDGVTPTTQNNTTASTTLATPAITAATVGALILTLVGMDLDSTSTNVVTGALSATNLSRITERHDQTVNTGVGGGVAAFEGFADTAGSLAIGAGSATQSSQTSSVWVGALRPAKAPPPWMQNRLVPMDHLLRR